ncbi:MAG: benzoyl-CoA oxygenase subunit B [Betaproteobacteria bacterium RIFCSPLOWO2_12_FULL_65_110]|nr:MAG: benzoyl-CoA oxygenase subunit B [Betaproteobacteria bacterium RIFCSPLOWO2_02_FULL_65_20]OGA41077.1 MAG: benzoyl-CoA oxygenase subunit B [Betaproteobacteria bacterium RIFCSPLOWO2_12_FULL_65_110]
MTAVDLACAIPNNVGLAQKPELRRSLEWFGVEFRKWWFDCGPAGVRDNEVYLRTPVGVDALGWARYGFVPLSQYRWGVFQAHEKPGRLALFGDIAGRPVWQTLPQAHRDYVRKLLVTQGDTEPGSVEQSRQLALTAPSLYDLRNLLQFSVEEGRHLWAMVHLLFEHVGAGARDDAEGLLARRSGSAGNARILDAFNNPLQDWLSYFMWCFLADRDGKYQLLSVSESGFDPLARSTQFMLTEEAHHMFIGEDGLRRVIQRTLDLMREHDTDDVAPHGGINLATIQRFFNFWAPRIYDLFGSDESPRAADAFFAGIKGRSHESNYDEHVRLDEGTVSVERRSPDASGGFVAVQVPMKDALNGVMRQAYLREVTMLMRRWNKMLARAGAGPEFRLPSQRFNRNFGVYAGQRFSPQGDPVDEAVFAARRGVWLPTEEDRAHLRAVQQPVLGRGRVAGWLAPPARGINSLPALDFDYVRL